MLERVPQQFRELQEITMKTDTRDILAHATRQSESYEDYFLVDVDAHVTESDRTHSTTLVARANSVGDAVMLSPFAVGRLITPAARRDWST